MRVLVSTTPGAGHVLAVRPIAAALAAAGHEVVWATGPDGVQLVASEGFDARTAGLYQPARMRRFAEGWGWVRDVPPHERRAVVFPALFASIAAGPMYRDLVPIAERVRPHVIVHEPSELAAVPLARRLGVPSICVGFGRFVPGEVLAAASTALSEVEELSGTTPPADLGLYDHAYFHPLPPSLEPAGHRPQVHHVRSELPPRSSGPADPSSSTVYVTFGTEFSAAAPWRAVLDALDRLGLEALCTTGSVDPADMGPVPPRVTLTRWHPQAHALDGAGLMISHGGSGAMLGALGAGVPHLALPMGADHFDNAELLVRSGIGAALDPEQVSVERIVEAVHQLLSEPDTRRRAQSASDALHALPGPAEAVRIIEDHVSRP